MANFTSITCQYQIGTDDTSTAFSNLTFNSASFGLRFASGGATTSTPSASWPVVSPPVSGTSTVTQLYAFSADTTGTLISTYTGTSANYRQLRVHWDNVGTYAVAPQFSFFSDSTLATPVAGTQPGAQSGSPIINGHATDTSSTSYMKIQAYGFGLTVGGASQTPNQSPDAQGVTAVSPTAGTAGAITTVTGAWNSSWTSGMGWLQYIVNGNIPKATTAGQWYFLVVLYLGANISTGSNMLPVFAYQYSYT